MSDNPITRAHNIILSALLNPENAKSQYWIDDATEVIKKDKDRWPALTFRTGEIPVDRLDEMFLIQSALRDGYYLTLGWNQVFAERWLPLSDILNLIGGE